MSYEIVHVAFSATGGAGRVARRIAEIQASAGIPSKALYLANADLRSEPYARPSQTISASLDNFLLKARTFDGPVSITRQLLGLRIKNEFAEGKIIHLHWPTGVIDIRSLEKLSSAKHVFVHLHDELALTGVCHFSNGCQNRTSGCRGCPAVRKIARHFPQMALSSKLDAWVKLAPTFVGPSARILNLLDNLEVAAEFERVVIPNPVSTPYLNSHGPRSAYSNRLIAVAENLDDPRKQIGELVAWFSRGRNPETNQTLVLVGRGGSTFAGLNGISVLGPKDPSQLANLFRAASLHVQFSKQEVAPLVLSEAAASGIPSAVLEESSQSDFVLSNDIGFTFRLDDSVRLVLERARTLVGRGALEPFLAQIRPEGQLAAYNELYSRL